MVRLKGGRTFFLFMVLLSALFLGLPYHLSGQDSGFKYIKNYSRKDYGEHPQNWSIAQGKRGIIYVGNNGGVLEFDGISWRLIEIINWSVRSMAVDDTGTVYIGGINEIGFLAPDSKGSLQYVSLRRHLDDDKLSFSYVKGAHATRGGIYFRAKEYLLRWDGKKINKWSPEGSFEASLAVEGKFFVYDKKAGLKKMVKDRLTPVPGGDTFAGKKIYMMVPYASEKVLVGTRSNGFYIYDGKTAKPFPTEVDNDLKEKELYHGIRLSSGDFALATLRGGLFIIDPHGKLKQFYNRKFGLQDDNIKYIFEDFQGNLWLGLSYGISKIEYASPISLYDERADLPKIVLSVTVHQQDLYVGAATGLFYFASSNKFLHVPGISTYCWSLLSTGESLLAVTSDGVFQVRNTSKNNVTRMVIDNRSFVLQQSRKDKNRVWVGTRQGLVSLYLKKENGRWALEQPFKKIPEEIQTIVEDQKGNLWLGTLTEGVLYLDVPAGGTITDPVVTRYYTSHGLPHGEINVFMAAGHVMFATTEKGIFCFDETKKFFIPDFTLGEEFAGPKGKGVFRIAEDDKKNIWFHSKSRNYQAIPQKDGTFVINSIPFLRISPVQVNVIYPDGDTVWFGSHDDLIRFDAAYRKNYRQDFHTLIRKVVVNEKAIIFYGHKINSGADSLFPTIAYENRNLGFEFAALSFEDVSSTRYRWFLEGYDENWSDFTTETQKDYTNLDSGSYTFRVQARNVYRKSGREDIFKFKVLPPWFKTWWAFSLYAMFFFLLVFFIVKWRSGKLEREKQKLEQTVKERTKELRERTTEIEEKNQQLEKQTLQLKEQSEKLKEMDKVKSRFFANISHEFRTPLTLIMGPLEQMLAGSRDKEQEKKINMMLRNSQRLLSLINQLLELSKFESGKVKLQTRRQNIIPFLKGIAATFEPAAAKNEVDLTFQAKEEEENITLYFDPEKLEEVLFNILANAIKFTPPAGRITVAAVRNRADEPAFPRGSLDISVCDTGPGIPRDQLSHIFDRFYQSDSTYEHHRKGSGIGLAIAKEIVELHHGKINVHSLEGKGTEFIIRLPLPGVPVDAKGVPADVKGGPVDVRGVPEDVDLWENDGDETGPVNDEQEIDPFEQAKDIILVVEDSADVRDYIRGSLEPDYAVEEAKDGREGINKAQEIIPDLIISDIVMPEADGYELCRVIKNDKNTSHVPVILLTARASEESILQGLETGADDYVTKPFNTKILRARIKNLIDLRRQMQANLNREMTLQPVKTSVSKLDREFIRELQEVIEKNLSDPEFNVEELKRKLYISRTSLYRKIQALSGQSPTDFIRSYRLKRAAQLLKNGIGSVTEVAFEVGFTSRSYFAKCFKEKFHQVPSTFKESEA